VSRRSAGAALGLAMWLPVLGGCAPRPPLLRAIQARGGPLRAVVREVQADVFVGAPGRWSWRTAFLYPDRYAWTIFTAAGADHYLFDGAVSRTFVESNPVSVDAGPDAPLRSHARFTAVTYLDALLLPGVQVTPLAGPELPEGAAWGLAAVFAGDGARYRLGFDARDLLVHVEGPLGLPPLGAGTLSARFADFHRTNGLFLPYRTAYTFGAAPLADERAVAVCPNVRLAPEAFRMPAAIPTCGRRR